MIKNYTLSLTTRTELFRQIDELLASNPSGKLYVNVTDKPKKRSLSANAQQHVWYKQISEFTGTDIRTVEAECKIDFGLPIILADEQVGKAIGYALDGACFWQMPREWQVRFIVAIQVTSLMSTKQHNQYRDNLCFYWNQNGLDIGYQDEEGK